MKYALGALPSRLDRRDYSVASFYPVGEPQTDIPPKVLLKTQNQGGVGACVAFGLEHQAAVHHVLEHGTEKRFDPNYIYGYRLDEHYQGEGMYPREAYQVMHRNGIADKGLLPWEGPVFYFGLKEHQKYYTPEVHSKAMYQRVKSYFACLGEAEIDAALQHGPVGITIPIYQSFVDVPADGMLIIPDMNRETFYGWHFVLIVGKRAGRWIIQHWWGDWGDQSMLGYCMAYMPVTYPIHEAWGVIDEELPRKQTQIHMFIGNPLAQVNGEWQKIDATNDAVFPILHQARTYLPIRFIAENLGLSVEWEQLQGRVTLTTER